MAMLNVQELLAQQLRANSAEAKIETKLAIGAFAPGVDKVSTGGVQFYIDTDVNCTKNSTGPTPTMTAESAAIARNAALELMTAKKDYAVGFFTM